MKYCISLLILAGVALAVPANEAAAWDESSPLIVNHHLTRLDQIPAEWINSVKADCKWHYAHTSHGGQLTVGCGRIEDADGFYDITIGSSYLPNVSGSFCVFDGQEGDTYIGAEEYWREAAGMNMTRAVLDNNPTINVSMFAWCGHMEIYGTDYVQTYLDSMAVLEQEYPDVTFVYMTGHAQGTGSIGYTRYINNEMIRAYCVNNNKVLFDFADLDSHWYNPATDEWEFATYNYNGHDIPVEHPQFHGDESMHTTYESCEQKGKAAWAMMAVLAGWPNYTIGVESENWGGLKSLFE